MVTLIYGDDIAASRNYFISQKQKYADAIALDGLTITLSDLTKALASDGLFTIEKHIFIEELLSKRKAGKELQVIIEYLIAHQNDADIFLWESKELTKAQLKQWNNATIKQFKLSQYIFQFLDGLHPKNAKQLITLFHKILETDDDQFVFFMFVRHIRLLIALHPQSLLKSETNQISDNQIDELKRMAPWQRTKLEKQAKLFSLDKLITLHSKLFSLDLTQKTGQLANSLTASIDFLLLEL